MKFLSLLLKYVLNVLRWIDCGVNCIFLLGSYNETISRRAAKARAAGRPWGCYLCKFLEWLNPGHCKNALRAKVGEDAIIPDDE